jgi:hypothetical protein
MCRFGKMNICSSFAARVEEAQSVLALLIAEIIQRGP